MERLELTIEDMFYDLEYLDPEYREALVKGLMDLKYLSDSPVKLRYGNLEQQRELENVYSKPLNANQIRELMSFIDKEMKDDFQYFAFKRVYSRYLKWADQIESYDTVQKKKLDTKDRSR